MSNHPNPLESKRPGRHRVLQMPRAAENGIGAALLRARERIGLSQMAIAARANIGWPTVSSVERGFREPSWFTLVALSKGLTCRIVIEAGEWRVEEL